MEEQKEENLILWYQIVLHKSEMIEPSTDIKSYYAIRPWCFSIWEQLQSIINNNLMKVFIYICNSIFNISWVYKRVISQ